MIIDVDKIKSSENKSLEDFISYINTDGLILEFGSGGSTQILSSVLKENILYSFDSFEGLPEDWEGYTHKKGEFKSAKPIDIPENVVYIDGWYGTIFA
jgi:hypothetical protein